MQLVKQILKNRKLILFLSKDDIKKKYAGSYLGIVWAFVQPLVTILIYWFVFQMGLKQTAKSTTGVTYPFIVWLMCGIIPWFFFSDALNSATSVFQEYTYLVKKVVFDIEILPIIKIISSLFIHLFFILILFLVMALFGYYPTVAFVQVIYYTLCMVALVIAISYFTASLNIFFKDLAQMVAVALQAGMWLTPIMWDFSMVSNYSWSVILKLNPVFYIVQGYRGALLDGDWFWNHGTLTIYFWAVVVVLMLIGNRIFKKLRPHFADVL